MKPLNSPSRRQFLTALVGAPPAALACMGRSRLDDDEWSTRPMSEPCTAASRGLTDLALRQHALLAKGGGNVFASPWSVWVALAMLAEGARGNTRDEILRTLGFGTPELQDRFLTAATELGTRVHASAKDVKLKTADGLWVDETFDLNAAYRDALRDTFDASVERLDFVRATEAARERINDWVSDRTNQRIDELFPEGSLDTSTRLVLTDAIWFYGEWKSPFDAKLTEERPFHRGDGSTVRVPTMRMKRDGKISVARIDLDGSTGTALELPYDGENLAMCVLMPDDANGLPELERRLDAERFREVTGALRPRRMSVELPKLELEQRFELTRPLAALGIRDAFSTSAADLSGMTASASRDLAVGGVVHGTYLRVDEKGTEAAAATGINVRVTSAMPSVLKVDRPFVVAIRDRRTEALLFLGRIEDPSA